MPPLRMRNGPARRAPNVCRSMAAPRRSTASATATPRAQSPLQEARTRFELARAEMAERELAKDKGKYIDGDSVRVKLTTLFTIVRNKLLSIPSKMGQRLPREKHDREVMNLVDQLIR